MHFITINDVKMRFKTVVKTRWIFSFFLWANRESKDQPHFWVLRKGHARSLVLEPLVEHYKWVSVYPQPSSSLLSPLLSVNTACRVSNSLDPCLTVFSDKNWDNTSRKTVCIWGWSVIRKRLVFRLRLWVSKKANVTGSHSATDAKRLREWMDPSHVLRFRMGKTCLLKGLAI